MQRTLTWCISQSLLFPYYEIPKHIGIDYPSHHCDGMLLSTHISLRWCRTQRLHWLSWRVSRHGAITRSKALANAFPISTPLSSHNEDNRIKLNFDPMEENDIVWCTSHCSIRRDPSLEARHYQRRTRHTTLIYIWFILQNGKSNLH